MTLIQNRIYIKVIFLSAINVYCGTWIFHVFVLVGKKWKNAIMYIIIMHYDLKISCCNEMVLNNKFKNKVKYFYLYLFH